MAWLLVNILSTVWVQCTLSGHDTAGCWTFDNGSAKVSLLIVRCWSLGDLSLVKVFRCVHLFGFVMMLSLWKRVLVCSTFHAVSCFSWTDKTLPVKSVSLRVQLAGLVWMAIGYPEPLSETIARNHCPNRLLVVVFSLWEDISFNWNL